MTPEPGRHRISAGAALVAVTLQIGYPLVDGAVRDAVTALVVVALAVAAFAHAGESRGIRAVGALGGVTVIGFAAEVLGVRTGVPFGSYAYADTLGPRVLGVPIVVALAWPMLAWPAAIAARRLARSSVARVAVGTWALTACDLFLDPQQVANGYWRWIDPNPHLPGVPGVPLSNFAGWLLVSAVISVLLQRAVAPAADDRMAAWLYVWFWAGWTVALEAFLDLRAAAAWGAVGMGAVAVPLAARLTARRPVPAAPTLHPATRVR